MPKKVKSKQKINKKKLESLHQQLLQLYYYLREKKRDEWSRDLPFEELLFDRWERAKNLGFGEGSSIYHNSYVMWDVKVGKHTWIGPFVMLDGRGGITIGSYCSISSGVHIYTHDSVKWALSGGKAEIEKAPVRIGNYTYIGSNTVIAKGVDIGDRCVIGACSFVNKNIPSDSIAFGIPVRVVGKVKFDADDIILKWKGEK